MINFQQNENVEGKIARDITFKIFKIMDCEETAKKANTFLKNESGKYEP